TAPTISLTRAVSVRLGSRERPLRTDNAAEVTKALCGALAGATGTTIVALQLGERLAPSHVPADSVGLPSTGRAFGQAFRYGLAPLDARARTALQNKVGDHGFRAHLS